MWTPVDRDQDIRLVLQEAAEDALVSCSERGPQHGRVLLPDVQETDSENVSSGLGGRTPSERDPITAEDDIQNNGGDWKIKLLPSTEWSLSPGRPGIKFLSLREISFSNFFLTDSVKSIGGRIEQRCWKLAS